MPAWLPKLILAMGVLSCIGMIIMAVLTSKESNPDKKKGLKAGAIITGVLGAIACGAGALMMWNEHVSVVPSVETTPGAEVVGTASTAGATADAAVAAANNALVKLQTGKPDEALEAAVEAVNSAKAAAAEISKANVEAKTGLDSTIGPAAAATEQAQLANTAAKANAAKANASAAAANLARKTAEGAKAAAEDAQKTAANTAKKLAEAKAAAEAAAKKGGQLKTLAQTAKALI